MTYSTNIDTHANGGELRNHKAFLSAGHDEYWSKEMFDAAEAARDAGVNLAFFGANAVYTAGAVRAVCRRRAEPRHGLLQVLPVDPYRSRAGADDHDGIPPATGEPPGADPHRRPVHTMTMPNTDYVVTNSSHWVYAGTGFSDGDVVPGIVGYEADSFMPNYPAPNSTNQTLLSRSPVTDAGVTKYQNSSIYQAPSGAWVFAVGHDVLELGARRRARHRTVTSSSTHGSSERPRTS